MSKGFVVLCALVCLAAAYAGSAKADSLVYTKGGKVYVAAPSGSGAHAVTATTGWTYPSQSDTGLIAALDQTGSISVMNQYGGVRNVVPTEESRDDFYATSFPRISPDGGRIAYGSIYPGLDPTVYWTPSTATTIDHPSQSIGQQDMTAPSWISGTKMMLTHFGQTVTPDQDQLYWYSAGGGDNSESGWAGMDPYAPVWATGFAGAISRQQQAVILAMDNQADNGGTTSNSVIDVFPTKGTPTSLDTSKGCRLTLLPNGSDSIADPGEISPSFSPDGTKFSYATGAGVWVANVPTDWSNCNTMSSNLVIPGGIYPYWSASSLVSADGSGTMTTASATVRAGSTKNTLSFTYKAASPGIASGTLSLTVPSGWSAPSRAATAPGYVIANHGTVTASGQMITVSNLTLPAGGTITVTYGYKGAGGPGATAPANGVVQTWTTRERSSSGGTMKALSASPSVDVLSRDGSGAMKSSLTSVTHASPGHTINFVYTAAAGGVSNGTVTLHVPSGWSAPSRTGSARGYTTANRGTVSVSGQTITVSGLKLAAGWTVTIVYGSKASGGPGATAPTGTGTQTWTTYERSSTAGALHALANSPGIAVK